MYNLEGYVEVLEFTKPAQTHHNTSGQYCENNNIIIWVMLEKESTSKENWKNINKYVSWKW
jgi:hypothetical protein